MADSRAKFLKVLKAELEDLLEDIGLAERRHSERLDRKEITEYVYKSNDALFHVEEEAIREIILLIDEMDLSLYTDLGQVCDSFETLVRETVKDREEPEAICAFVFRKVQKVRSYVSGGDVPSSI